MPTDVWSAKARGLPGRTRRGGRKGAGQRRTAVNSITPQPTPSVRRLESTTPPSLRPCKDRCAHRGMTHATHAHVESKREAQHVAFVPRSRWRHPRRLRSPALRGSVPRYGRVWLCVCVRVFHRPRVPRSFIASFLVLVWVQLVHTTVPRAALFTLKSERLPPHPITAATRPRSHLPHTHRRACSSSSSAACVRLWRGAHHSCR